MKNRFHAGRLLIPVLLAGLTGGAALALAQPDMPSTDILARLRNSLQAAGASALTSAQEASINTLIVEFMDARRDQPQTARSDESARTAYENAILNGDSATAASEAVALSNARATGMAQREADAAALAIRIIEVLKVDSTAQVDALVTQLGKSGFVRLILSLAGGPGGFGPGGRGPGRPPQP